MWPGVADEVLPLLLLGAGIAQSQVQSLVILDQV